MFRPYDPRHSLRSSGFGLFPVRSPLLRESLRFLFLWLLRCFTSPGWHPLARICRVHLHGFPHSDIPGSQPAQRLPEAFRSHATSFIAIMCLGILRTPLISTVSVRAAALNTVKTACTVIDALITRKLLICCPYLRPLQSACRGWFARGRLTPRTPTRQTSTFPKRNAARAAW